MFLLHLASHPLTNIRVFVQSSQPPVKYQLIISYSHEFSHQSVKSEKTYTLIHKNEH